MRETFFETEYYLRTVGESSCFDTLMAFLRLSICKISFDFFYLEYGETYDWSNGLASITYVFILLVLKFLDFFNSTVLFSIFSSFSAIITLAVSYSFWLKGIEFPLAFFICNFLVLCNRDSSVRSVVGKLIYFLLPADVCLESLGEGSTRWI